jgi:hypothetical protein
MLKKRVSVKKKVTTSKSPSKILIEKKADKCCSSWIWYVLGILILLAALFFVYKGMTGNVITGNATNPLQSGWENFLKPSLEYLLGWDISGDANNKYQMDDFFSMALLILIIVFSIVFVVVKSIPFFSENSWSVWVVSIAVSLLSVRFLSAEWLITILLPYSTLGIVISAGFPFILYFFLVDKFPHPKGKTGLLQKIAWIFFGIVFLYLWYSRTQTASTPALDDGPYYTIYLWTAIAALFMALIGQKAAAKGKAIIDNDKDESRRERDRAIRELNKLHTTEQNLQSMVDEMTLAGELDSARFKKTREELNRVSARIAELRRIAYPHLN